MGILIKSLNLEIIARAINGIRLFFFTAAILPALPGPPQAFQSPEVHSDNRVTFRFRAPNAKEVFLIREGAPRIPMHKDELGIWSITTDPLEPDFYAHRFVADDVTLIDPSNPVLYASLLTTQSVAHVPGSSSLPWELSNVTHGMIHRHVYRSEAAGDYREFYVYTPPGYSPKANKVYPVLYLLHGFNDDAGAWIAAGRAHLILDNLIGQGKAKPMLIVMPFGHGAPSYRH